MTDATQPPAALWPKYRERYLGAYSLAGLRSIPARHKAYVVIATGAIEQHGPQLPVGVDSLCGQAYLDRALPRLEKDAPVYVTPPILVGKSNEHTGFPGTLILSRESLRQQLLAIGRQLFRWGFRRIGILNTHGGNVSVVKSTLRELALEAPDSLVSVEIIHAPYEQDLNERERAFGIHANEVETSLLYAYAPHMTRPERANCCWMGELGQAGELKAEFAPATFAWKTTDLSPSGTLGDAAAATAENGALWLERASEALARFLQRRADEAAAME